MTDYILASLRPILGDDKRGKCELCGKEAWYSWKSHMLTMGDSPLPVFCTGCMIPTETAESVGQN